jgi:hypothetical protein
LADTLDQDVRVLRNWLRSAWRQLAGSSMTRFERQELRNDMREAEVALRLVLKGLAARDRVRAEAYANYSQLKLPDFRVLRVVSADR